MVPFFAECSRHLSRTDQNIMQLLRSYSICRNEPRKYVRYVCAETCFCLRTCLDRKQGLGNSLQQGIPDQRTQFGTAAMQKEEEKEESAHVGGTTTESGKRRDTNFQEGGGRRRARALDKVGGSEDLPTRGGRAGQKVCVPVMQRTECAKMRPRGRTRGGSPEKRACRDFLLGAWSGLEHQKSERNCCFLFAYRTAKDPLVPQGNKQEVPDKNLPLCAVVNSSYRTMYLN